MNEHARRGRGRARSRGGAVARGGGQSAEQRREHHAQCKVIRLYKARTLGHYLI